MTAADANFYIVHTVLPGEAHPGHPDKILHQSRTPADPGTPSARSEDTSYTIPGKQNSYALPKTPVGR
jgi:hypothetical protein